MNEETNAQAPAAAAPPVPAPAQTVSTETSHTETADHGAAHEGGFLADPAVWVAVSFVIFWVLVWKKAKVALEGIADKKIEAIRAQLADANRIRDDAIALLDKSTKRHAEAAKEADAIIAHARDEAKRIGDEAKAALDRSLKLRESQAMARIAQAEAQAVADLRGYAADVAVKATARVMMDSIDPERADALINTAITELPQALN